MSEGPYYVYILASKRNGTLYIGVMSNLIKRVHQHKNRFFDGFTKKYDVHMLVHYEVFFRPLFRTGVGAIQREKRLKKWKRQWKMEEGPGFLLSQE